MKGKSGGGERQSFPVSRHRNKIACHIQSFTLHSHVICPTPTERHRHQLTCLFDVWCDRSWLEKVCSVIFWLAFIFSCEPGLSFFSQTETKFFIKILNAFQH